MAQERLARTREKIRIMTLTLEQERERFVRRQASTIENDLFKLFAEVRELGLETQIWQIIVLFDEDPRAIKLADFVKYARNAPQEFSVLMVSSAEGEFHLRKSSSFEKGFVANMPDTEHKDYYEYGLWALKAMRAFLGEEQAKLASREGE